MLTLFGIVPTNPATGYGYIRAGKEVSAGGGARFVAAFVEKPDRETAKSYLKSGSYLWNSGIILASAETLIDELRTHAPKIVESAEGALEKAEQDTAFLRLDRRGLRGMPGHFVRLCSAGAKRPSGGHSR